MLYFLEDNLVGQQTRPLLVLKVQNIYFFLQIAGLQGFDYRWDLTSFNSFCSGFVSGPRVFPCQIHRQCFWSRLKKTKNKKKRQWSCLITGIYGGRLGREANWPEQYDTRHVSLFLVFSLFFMHGISWCPEQVSYLCQLSHSNNFEVGNLMLSLNNLPILGLPTILHHWALRV